MLRKGEEVRRKEAREAYRATKVPIRPPPKLLAIHTLTRDTPLFSLQANGCVTPPVPLLHISGVHCWKP